jgi:hypothetical protein
MQESAGLKVVSRERGFFLATRRLRKLAAATKSLRKRCDSTRL